MIPASTLLKSRGANREGSQDPGFRLEVYL